MAGAKLQRPPTDGQRHVAGRRAAGLREVERLAGAGGGPGRALQPPAGHRRLIPAAGAANHIHRQNMRNRRMPGHGQRLCKCTTWLRPRRSVVTSLPDVQGTASSCDAGVCVLAAGWAPGHGDRQVHRAAGAGGVNAGHPRPRPPQLQTCAICSSDGDNRARMQMIPAPAASPPRTEQTPHPTPKQGSGGRCSGEDVCRRLTSGRADVAIPTVFLCCQSPQPCAPHSVRTWACVWAKAPQKRMPHGGSVTANSTRSVSCRGCCSGSDAPPLRPGIPGGSETAVRPHQVLSDLQPLSA